MGMVNKKQGIILMFTGGNTRFCPRIWISQYDKGGVEEMRKGNNGYLIYLNQKSDLSSDSQEFLLTGLGKLSSHTEISKVVICHERHEPG